MADEIIQRQQQAPYIEKRSEQLLASVFGDPNAVRRKDADGKFTETEEAFNLRKFGRAGIAQKIPGYEFAGFTPEQQRAFGLASQNIGGYAPALQAGLAQTGLGATTQAIGAGTMAQASPLFQGAIQAYDPRSAKAFMDPYQQQVTQQALAELDRQAAMQGQRTAAEAVAAGAFGGSRFGVREAEEARNLAQVKSQRIFEDLSRNFLQAQQAQQRTAQQLGQLGTQTLGVAQAQSGLGSLGQQLQGVDINRLLSVGGVQQQQAQNVLEAARQTELARQQEPFRRVGFASDILRGVPTSQIQYTSQPSPSLFQQVAGLGIAGLSTLGALGGTGAGISLLA